MRYISLDVSTKFLAYALWKDGALEGYGHVYPSGSGDEGAGSISIEIQRLFKKAKIDIVVYESAFLGKNVEVVKSLSKFTGSMIGGFYMCGVREFCSVPPITWQNGIGVGRTPRAEMDILRKKHPNRSASWIKNVDRENRKQLVINYVNEKYNVRFSMQDNDLADAIAIGNYMWGKWQFDKKSEE